MKWTEEENQILIEARKLNIPYKEIVVAGRTETAVTGQISLLIRQGRIQKNQNFSRWTNAEENILKNMRQKGCSFAEIASELGRTEEAVRTRNKRFSKGINKTWSKAEEEILKDSGKTRFELAILLNKSERAVGSKLEKLRLIDTSSYTDEYLLDLVRKYKSKNNLNYNKR